MDFQGGITKDHAESISQNMSTSSETSEDGLKCPKCGKDVLDKRIIDIDGSKICQTSPKGNKLPAFTCADNDDFKNHTCSFASWKLDKAESVKVEKEEIPF